MNGDTQKLEKKNLSSVSNCPSTTTPPPQPPRHSKKNQIYTIYCMRLINKKTVYRRKMTQFVVIAEYTPTQSYILLRQF